MPSSQAFDMDCNLAGGNGDLFDLGIEMINDVEAGSDGEPLDSSGKVSFQGSCTKQTGPSQSTCFHLVSHMNKSENDEAVPRANAIERRLEDSASALYCIGVVPTLNSKDSLTTSSSEHSTQVNMGREKSVNSGNNACIPGLDVIPQVPIILRVPVFQCFAEPDNCGVLQGFVIDPLSACNCLL